MNPNTLAVLGRQLLANVITDLSVAGLAVPDRQFFSHAAPARVCNQLAVYLRELDIGGGGDTSQRASLGPSVPGAITHIAQWAIDLALCGAAGDMPEPDAATLTADAVMGSTYLWALTRSLTARWKNSSVFAPYDVQINGRGVTVQPATIGEDGGLVVVTASFAANVRDLS